MSDEITNEVVELNQDSKNLATIMWVLTIFFGFIPSLIFYLIKDDDAYVKDQAKEALNWSITTILAYVAGVILSIILIGVLVLLAVGILHLGFCIMGAIATSSGKSFRVPLTLRLLK